MGLACKCMAEVRETQATGATELFGGVWRAVALLGFWVLSG